MAETNKNHAPVAASLHLDDERAKPKLMPCAHCGCADVEFDSPGGPDESSFDFVICNGCGISAGRADCDGDLHEVWNRRTPPAEVSADTLPALPKPDVRQAAAPVSHPTAYSKEALLSVIAPYAEQIKNAREYQRKVDEKIIERQAEQIKKLERELAERKQSIDTPEFRELLIEYWNCTLGGEEERTLIAYIDARPAGTAPAWQPIETAPGGEILLLAAEFDRPGDWRIKVGGHWEDEWHVFGASWEPTHWMPLPAAPSLSTGTEESK